MTDLMQKSNDSNRLMAILSNTEYFAILTQAQNDLELLMNFLPTVSPAMFSFAIEAERGTGLLKMGRVCVPFDARMSEDSNIYKLVKTS